jgi:hypothetical protein
MVTMVFARLACMIDRSLHIYFGPLDRAAVSGAHFIDPGPVWRAGPGERALARLAAS